jgi:hypothetical protein
MKFWPWQKRRKRWNPRWNPAWYSTPELQNFLQLELELISYRARPVHEHIAQVGRLENEIARRTSLIEGK